MRALRLKQLVRAVTIISQLVLAIFSQHRGLVHSTASSATCTMFIASKQRQQTELALGLRQLLVPLARVGWQPLRRHAMGGINGAKLFGLQVVDVGNARLELSVIDVRTARGPAAVRSTTSGI